MSHRPPASAPPPAESTPLADELARTQAELHRLQRLFRSAFEHQFQFMALLAPDGRVVDFNAQFAPGPALPREEVIGRPFWQAAWWRDEPALAAEWPQRLQAALASDRAVVYRDRFTSSTGEPRTAEAAVHALRDEQGRPEGFVVQATDTTERQRAEALRDSAERQLRDAQRLSAIGTLAGGIAHDFNNILGAILGNLALALDALPAEHAARGPLAQIERASQRGRALVRQILEFSRNEAADLRVEPLQALVDEAVSLLRPTLPPAVSLQARLDGATVWARVNGAQLHRVVMNLCTNALHALREGRGEIVVGVVAGPQGGALLWVSDDGIGMDEATQRRALEPFFTTKPVDQGSGLGLSVVHGIVTAHGGTLRIDSAPGRGTTVWVSLPAVATMATPAGDAHASPLAAEAIGGAAPGDRARWPARHPHVLYLDDDEVIAPVAEALLRRAGYRVSTHSQADAALAALRAADPAIDVLVTDYQMPGRNGLEVIRLVRAQAPALPVVLASGFIDDGLRAQAAALGVTQLVAKEDIREGLCRAVQAALDAA